MTNLFDLPFEDADPEPVSAAPVRRVLSVSELTAEIRTVVERRFPQVWVEGEISNCRKWHTGHVYFTLKDSSAQIKAVMFRTATRYLRFNLEDGLHVVIRGQVSVYDPKGEYQVVCEHVEPHGLGALQLAFDQLKRRLQAEGLFAPARKRPLPALPRKIGIVTSIDGAALRDIVKVLRRRYPNAHVIIRPSRVQGDGAAADIARALAAIGSVPGVDVIIIGRGGGSIEDLWAFNEEVVARAIAAVPVPVISAVGHETDVTIADFVADLRAPTPSAAAEMVVERKDAYCSRIDRLGTRCAAGARARVQRLKSLVLRVEGRPGLAGWPARLAMRGRHASELSHQLARASRANAARRGRQYQDLRLRLETLDLRLRMGRVRNRLMAADRRLQAAAVRKRHFEDARLRGIAGRLGNLSPLAVLARGYAVCWDAAKTVIVRDAAQVDVGDRVRVTLARGELLCEVKEP